MYIHLLKYAHFGSDKSILFTQRQKKLKVVSSRSFWMEFSKYFSIQLEIEDYQIIM